MTIAILTIMIITAIGVGLDHAGVVSPRFHGELNIATSDATAHTVTFAFAIENNSVRDWTVQRIRISGAGLSTIASLLVATRASTTGMVRRSHVTIAAHSSALIGTEVRIDDCTAVANQHDSKSVTTRTVEVEVQQFVGATSVHFDLGPTSGFAAACSH